MSVSWGGVVPSHYWPGWGAGAGNQGPPPWAMGAPERTPTPASAAQVPAADPQPTQQAPTAPAKADVNYRRSAHLDPQQHPFADTPPDGAAIGTGTHVAAVRLRGLPFTASEADVLAFFAQHDVVDRIAEGSNRVNLLPRANGRPSGQAVVQMRDRQEADLAQKVLHGQWMGSRYIEVFVYGDNEGASEGKSNPTTKEDVPAPAPGPPPAGPGPMPVPLAEAIGCSSAGGDGGLAVPCAWAPADASPWGGAPLPWGTGGVTDWGTAFGVFNHMEAFGAPWIPAGMPVPGAATV